jgi:hypothetical protein
MLTYEQLRHVVDTSAFIHRTLLHLSLAALFSGDTIAAAVVYSEAQIITPELMMVVPAVRFFDQIDVCRQYRDCRPDTTMV